VISGLSETPLPLRRLDNVRDAGAALTTSWLMLIGGVRNSLHAIDRHLW
jgi:hypothetical protein